MIELEKGKTGLGLSLAGNRDRSRMSVFVVGIDPGGAAGRDGRMTVGDELLEVRPRPRRHVQGEERALIPALRCVLDQRADPVRPQSPERVRHHQELRLEGQDHLHQVGTSVPVMGRCGGAAGPAGGAGAAVVGPEVRSEKLKC